MSENPAPTNAATPTPDDAPLTRSYVLRELRSSARQSDDAAAACEAGAALHRPEFERCVHVEPPDATPELHERALELYGQVIHPEHEARRLRREAQVFREAAELLDPNLDVVSAARVSTADARSWLRIFVNDDAHWPERDHPRRKMLRAVLLALPGGEGGWKPIESAPRSRQGHPYIYVLVRGPSGMRSTEHYVEKAYRDDRIDSPRAAWRTVTGDALTDTYPEPPTEWTEIPE